MELGNRIVIVGVSASGKSTFARKVSEKTGIPLTLMDSIMWKPGWEYVGDDETNRQLQEIAKTDSWIIEGYIARGSRTHLFDRATAIIHLDYAPHIASWRYIKRWWKHRKAPRDELKGSPESFSLKFLWLVWTKGEAIGLKKFLSEVEQKEKIVVFKSPKEAVQFLEQHEL